MTTDKLPQRNMCAYTIALILVWLAVIQLQPASAVSTTQSPDTITSPAPNPLVEHKHERNCKALCEHCGCLGFYCGEECLCECNNENSDTECIRTMQENARTLNSPFEILIQGPSSNRFVRNAQQFEQKPEVLARRATTRNRRSTITIYKPALVKSAALAANAVDLPSSITKKSDVNRLKRSVDHMEWFNDFASSLVRPSPLGTRAAQKQQREALKRQATSAPVEPLVPLIQREPWFLEQSAAPLLTRPAPLFKRQQQQSSSKTKKSPPRKLFAPVSIEEESPKTEELDIRPLRDGLEVLERIPRVLQDTVNHLANDKQAGDVFSLNIRSEDHPKPKKARKNRTNALRRSGMKSLKLPKKEIPLALPVTQAPLVAPPPTLPQRGALLNWLRQQRELRRQQRARNI